MFASASDLILLQRVVESAKSVLRECRSLVSQFRVSINKIVVERQQDVYITIEGPLENQALFEATSLLNSQRVTSEDAQSLGARSRTSTQLHYQIGVVEKKLGSGSRHNTRCLRPLDHLVFRESTHIVILRPGTNSHCSCKGSDRVYPCVPK